MKYTQKYLSVTDTIFFLSVLSKTLSMFNNGETGVRLLDAQLCRGWIRSQAVLLQQEVLGSALHLPVGGWRDQTSQLGAVFCRGAGSTALLRVTAGGKIRKILGEQPGLLISMAWLCGVLWWGKGETAILLLWKAGEGLVKKAPSKCCFTRETWTLRHHSCASGSLLTKNLSKPSGTRPGPALTK